jgi:hypothetical protein
MLRTVAMFGVSRIKPPGPYDRRFVSVDQATSAEPQSISFIGTLNNKQPPHSKPGLLCCICT